jgi:hypothetical protein
MEVADPIQYFQQSLQQAVAVADQQMQAAQVLQVDQAVAAPVGKPAELETLLLQVQVRDKVVD